jgi:hypothetical protein
MESYALLECGHEAANTRFSSLARHACPPESHSLGKLPLDIRDVASLGAFGRWCERQQDGELVRPVHDDPLLDRLDETLDRWIHGHRSVPGIALDATQTLGQEAEKLLGVLVDDGSVEVSEAVTQKLRRIVDYFEQVNVLWSATLCALVDASESDDAWRVVHRPSREIATELIQHGMEDAAYRKTGWWLGALAADSLILPLVGPILRSSSAGWLITHLQDRRQHRQLMKRLGDYSDLVALHVAKNQLLVVATTVTRFLASQPLGAQAVLYARGTADGESAVLIGPRTARRWYARPFRKRWDRRLTALAAPIDS